MGRRWTIVTVAVVLVATACARGDDDDAGAPVAPELTLGIATGVPPELPTTAVATTTAIPATTAVPSTVAPTTTVAPGLVGRVTDALEVVEIGRSVEHRPITAVRRGSPGGTVVLVVGVIHGDEDDGVAILERLATAPVPDDVDLWLVESMNPDGQVAQRRTNANLVDLNRNFPYDWAPLGEPGDSEYGGTGPASEPETRAIVDLITTIQPDLGIWYHQDLFRIAPGSGRDGELRARYAYLTGLPLLSISGGTYTGVAATWQRNTVDGVAFIVELGPSLTPAEADTHAATVLDLAATIATN